MTLTQRALALREGGQTIRCHTMQYIGPYNVAIHSYNMMTLLFTLYPGQPSLNLIRAVQFHDVPERWTGDVPTPAKMASSSFRQELVALEEKVLAALGIGEVWSCLTEDERCWLNAVDLLELFIWGQEQLEFGNRLVDKMNNKIYDIFYAKWDKIPHEVKEVFENFRYTRSPEYEELVK